MSTWTAKEIKSLRLRLGWSAADFSRHFGCHSDLILKWEGGEASPSPDDLLQLKRLAHYLNTYSEQVAIGPAVECEIERRGLSQICVEEVFFVTKES